MNELGSGLIVATRNVAYLTEVANSQPAARSTPPPPMQSSKPVLPSNYRGWKSPVKMAPGTKHREDANF